MSMGQPSSDPRPYSGRSDLSALRGNRLLAALPGTVLQDVAPHIRPVNLERGRVLFEPGDDVDLTHFPTRSAIISLQLVTRDGREVEAASIGREGAAGGIVSSGHKPAYGRAVVQIAGPVLVIATEQLEAAKRRRPEISDLFSRYADALLAQVMQSVVCNALHPVEQRACRWLLSTHDRSETNIIRLTQQSLAEMLGVQRTTVSGVAKILEHRGLIRQHHGHVEVIDRAGLEEACCECYQAVEDHYALLLPEVVED
ncbi:Crp/Fnr family transcriptional regulator [Phenylobacterium sp.]|uniref:Crp/Fnr family transcriptional regulator n=1 Tax=Phenylobacterium sp. TaxID=1871053 RepID=UPI00272FC1D5|nr:Crp/Fnr family transcriptional regulator [Phenylobacterium sp.]MDP1872679.1 Crp/Fnr family transcriptional regulator [Phenylobacterium sp.]MDP3490781.1 Crp/Fnr family transcriptional regulator [Phenylobacterium sp.]